MSGGRIPDERCEENERAVTLNPLVYVWWPSFSLEGVEERDPEDNILGLYTKSPCSSLPVREPMLKDGRQPFFSPKALIPFRPARYAFALLPSSWYFRRYVSSSPPSPFLFLSRPFCLGLCANKAIPSPVLSHVRPSESDKKPRESQG